MKIEVNRPAPVEIACEKSPSALSIMWRELVRDRLALVSLIILSVILLIVYGASIFLDQEEIVKVDFLAIYSPPSAEHWLGTDYGGRDVFGQLIIGARNSFTIGLAITLITGAIGLVVGLVDGLFRRLDRQRHHAHHRFYSRLAVFNAGDRLCSHRPEIQCGDVHFDYERVFMDGQSPAHSRQDACRAGIGLCQRIQDARDAGLENHFVSNFAKLKLHYHRQFDVELSWQHRH